MTDADGLLCWVDASAGIAGDMLLAALLDAGAPIGAVQQSIDAVLPGAVRVAAGTVTRAGMRALKLRLQFDAANVQVRSWQTIRALLQGAELDELTRGRAIATFERLAVAEAQVHDVEIDEVHFHEVGSLDSIADVVGCCAALSALKVSRLLVSVIAVGSGTVTTAHGTMPVPVPAVLELSRGWRIAAVGSSELATPTGMALVTAFAEASAELPELDVVALGIGAGERDPDERANVVRVVLGRSPQRSAGQAVITECNVDDLDPRVWPSVLERLLKAGASDAWLTPILMKKGRPAHTLHVLSEPADAAELSSLVLAYTSTIGLRQYPVSKQALDRDWVSLAIGEASVRIKVAHAGGRILNVSPEFDDIAGLAAAGDEPVSAVLARVNLLAERDGLSQGQVWPKLGG